MQDTQALTDLVSSAQAGDLEAFDALVRRFQDMAVGYAYSRLGEWGPAQDAAQEAFIQLYRDLPKLRAPEAFLTWFRRIIFKHCDRAWRTRRPEVLSLEQMTRAEAAEAGPARTTEEPEATAPVRTALATLAKPERAAIVLFYYQDASLKDMAAFLDVSPSVIDHRLRTARKHLSERLLAMTQHDLQDNRPSNDAQFVLRVMDGLTRLANMDGLTTRLREECQIGQTRASGFGVVLYDVDHLLVFNAERGHVAGDALLAALAERMRVVLRADDYAARYGGDELALVLRRPSAQAALADARAVQAAAVRGQFSLGALLQPEARYGASAPLLPPSPANAQFQHGLKYLQAGQANEAAEAFRAALASDAKHAPSEMELAYLDLRQSLSPAQLAETFQVSLSGGVSWYQAGDTPETLIARADAALARAKQTGRNRVQLST